MCFTEHHLNSTRPEMISTTSSLKEAKTCFRDSASLSVKLFSRYLGAIMSFTEYHLNSTRPEVILTTAGLKMAMYEFSSCCLSSFLDVIALFGCMWYVISGFFSAVLNLLRDLWF